MHTCTHACMWEYFDYTIICLCFSRTDSSKMGCTHIHTHVSAFCLFACLYCGLLVYLFVCLISDLLIFLFVGLLVCLIDCLPACLPCLPACLPACRLPVGFACSREPPPLQAEERCVSAPQNSIWCSFCKSNVAHIRNPEIPFMDLVERERAL